MADITRINEILADVLETLGGTVSDAAAREFLGAMMIATIRLEQHDVPAAMAPPLMAALMGEFLGDQKAISRKERRQALELAINVLVHAFNLSSGGEADDLYHADPARGGKRR